MLICNEKNVNTPIALGNDASIETQINTVEYDFNIALPDKMKVVVTRSILKNPSLLIPPGSSKSSIFVFSDETVYSIYGEKFIETLLACNYNVHKIVIPDGEESKSIANYVYLVERILKRDVDENSLFISLGGGVVCNVCGFVASTIYRGMDLIHVPTTLMAQCDAAISHKQAVNGNQGKNHIGSYYPPKLVVVDPCFLDTLSPSRLSDGLAEVIKHGIGQDSTYFDMLLSYNGHINNIDFLETGIKQNIKLKQELIEVDPHEKKEGMILQYGHTIGHIIEHLSGHSIFHGEAVAIGMMAAAKISYILGACSRELVNLHKKILHKYNLPTEIPAHIAVNDIIDALKYGKRYLNGFTQMALLSDVGKLWQKDGKFTISVSKDTILEALRWNEKLKAKQD